MKQSRSFEQILHDFSKEKTNFKIYNDQLGESHAKNIEWKWTNHINKLYKFTTYAVIPFRIEIVQWKFNSNNENVAQKRINAKLKAHKKLICKNISHHIVQ